MTMWLTGHRSLSRLVLGALCLVLAAGNVVRAAPAPDLTVDLHAHLFMKEGLGALFVGDFDGPLRSRGWRSLFRSMANPATLESSRIGIVVASLYALPGAVLSLRDSIRKQIDHAERFVNEHPQWVIARSSQEARVALASGKRVMVLAIEGASGILEHEEDFREFIDRGGVRIVTFMHLTDDCLGSAAFLPGFGVLFSPFAQVRRLFDPHYDENGIAVNSRGITQKGRAFVQAMIDRGVWLDLAHSSDATQRAIVPMLRERSVPLLYSHTILRQFHGAERGISPSQLRDLRDSKGIVGLMPCESSLAGTPPEPGHCRQGIGRFARQYRDLVAALGAESVMLGSDFNGGVNHLPPSCPLGTGLDRDGLWNISQVPELWRSLHALGQPVPEPRVRMVEKFLETWERVEHAAAP